MGCGENEGQEIFFFELGAGGDGGRRDAIVETKVEGIGCGKEGKRERGS